MFLDARAAASRSGAIVNNFFGSGRASRDLPRPLSLIFATMVSALLLTVSARSQIFTPLSEDHDNTVSVPQSDNQSQEEVPKFSFSKAEKQPDGSLRAESGLGDFVVQNPDQTTIVHIETFINLDGTSGQKDVFNAGPDCDENSFKKIEVKECLPDPKQDGRRFWFNVTYYEYTCKVKPGIRRIRYSAVSTGEACGEVQQPTLCQIPLKVRPVSIVEDAGGAAGFYGVIWEDESGKEYTVTYSPDGTATGFPGTPPPKPDPSDIKARKWYIPPDIQKQLEKANDAAKELEKVLTDPNEANRLLQGACNAVPPVLAAPPANSGEKTTKSQSTEHKRPRRASRPHGRRETETLRKTKTSSTGGGGIEIGIGIERFGGFGSHGRGLGGHGLSREGKSGE